MSDNILNAAETTPAAAPARKAAKKAAAKRPAPKAKKAAAKAAPAAANGKPALLKPMVRILAALAKAKNGLDRHGVAAKANVNINWVAEYLGGTANPVSDEVRGVKKLVPAGLAEVLETDHDGKVERSGWGITAKGRKALAAATGG